jgi:succinate dehydrogenase / fumarate reductase iron-sulfur subunit
MRILLKIWRQSDSRAPGQFVDYAVDDVSGDMSFLEMLDVLNETLIASGEGICGACGFLINGIAHGPDPGTTVCQLHMRRFSEGDRVILEPWRAKAFPVVKDLVVDRSAFDRIIQAGGYTSINVGGAQDANAILIAKATVEKAMDSAACIACGACVAACKNASAVLFTSAKVSHLALLPQGQPERRARVIAMLDQHDAEGFGSCSNEGECEAVCPKEIPITNIARLNREYLRAMLLSRDV